MEDDEGGGFRLGKKPLDKGEVDYKTKAGTAWSHSYLNQKPWHPLSYPNQRRKWIAEQTHAQKQRRAEEVSREYAQEQEFFRQTALISKKEKEKLEMMKSVSFMYVKPPGYNAESAKAAELAAEKKMQDQERNIDGSHEASVDEASASKKAENIPSLEDKKKPRPKDVFGRSLPTEEQFEVLKNAPRLETGVAARSKPFGIEIRNVKCLRCGNYGHQSGDRECPLKDAIMPNEENRLKRDDPLTAIQAQTDLSEHLKWELKQKPGMSPPRGGFTSDDPNQQIVAEDIFDEYGGFLTEAVLPELLTNFSSSKPRKKKSSKYRKSKHRKRSLPSSTDEDTGPSSSDEKRRRSRKHKRKMRRHSESSSSEKSDGDTHQRSNRHKHRRPKEPDVSDTDELQRNKNRHHHRDRQHHRRHHHSDSPYE